MKCVHVVDEMALTCSLQFEHTRPGCKQCLHIRLHFVCRKRVRVYCNLYIYIQKDRTHTSAKSIYPPGFITRYNSFRV